jgi:hypothetical protein
MSAAEISEEPGLSLLEALEAEPGLAGRRRLAPYRPRFEADRGDEEILP